MVSRDPIGQKQHAEGPDFYCTETNSDYPDEQAYGSVDENAQAYAVNQAHPRSS